MNRFPKLKNTLEVVPYIKSLFYYTREQACTSGWSYIKNRDAYRKQLSNATAVC